MKTSQKERVKKRLNEMGLITRNQCLSTFPAITRLSAIILVLKDDGYEFETIEKDGDYIYKVINKPKKAEYVYSKEKNMMVKVLS